MRKALIELKKEEDVEKVTEMEEKHCFRSEETLKTTRRRKTPRWILCSFKERRRNYMKGRLYLNQLLLFILSEKIR